MKKIYSHISILLLISIFSSCTIQKRVHRPGYHVSPRNMYVSMKKRDKKEPEKPDEYYSLLANENIYKSKNNKQKSDSIKYSNNGIAHTEILQTQHPFYQTKIKQESCDQLVLKNGEDRLVLVREITTTEIKYNKCDNQNGVIYTVPISDVLFIKYANGTKESFDKTNYAKETNPVLPETNSKSEDLETHPLAIAGFIFAFIFPFLGSILCFLAVKQILKNSDRYKGKKLAVAGSVVALILSIIILALIMI